MTCQVNLSSKKKWFVLIKPLIYEFLPTLLDHQCVITQTYKLVKNNNTISQSNFVLLRAVFHPVDAALEFEFESEFEFPGGLIN